MAENQSEDGAPKKREEREIHFNKNKLRDSSIISY